MTTIQEFYNTTVVPALKEQFGFKNVFNIPKITKITINVGVGRSMKDPDFIGVVEKSLVRITGQKPVKTRAKKSIASFKLREGAVIGMMVTLRGARMYDFLQKLVHVAFPRIRDFRGITTTSVDRNGNLTVGFKENLPFPEIRSDEVERVHGLEICISTTAKTREEGVALFTLLGFPFKK